jgi:hypothetical protein
MRRTFRSWLCLLAIGGVAATNNVPPAGLDAGTVVALDLPARQLTLQTATGRQTYRLTPRTYIFRDQEKLAADQLKPGDRLKLSYYRDETGQRLVNRIKFALPEQP